MKRVLYALFALVCIGCSSEAPRNELRAPAYPLITIDPYINSWSSTDRLYDDAVRHWTTSETPLTGVARVDGVCYRFMGAETEERVEVVPMGFFEPWSGRYTSTKPSKGWAEPDFDDSAWQRGQAPFGNDEQKRTRTQVKCGKYFWMRRQAQIDPATIEGNKFYACCSYNYGAQIFINGIEIPNKLGFCETDFRHIEIPREAMERSAKDGKITMAMRVSARNKKLTFGDIGIYRAVPCDNGLFERTAEQLGVDVQATRTIYDFRCGGVELKLTFTAPLLLDNLDLMSRPVNYVSYEVASSDGKPHNVELYFEAGEEWARHYQEQRCITEIKSDERLDYLSCRTEEQPVLQRVGDNARIDWGTFYLAAPKGHYTAVCGDKGSLRNTFADSGVARANAGEEMALCRSLGAVGREASKGYFMVGYDDIYSIQYFGENIRPYWNRRGDSTIEEQLTLAAEEYESLAKRCAQFDAELMREARRAGGKEYAELCALAYRHTIAAHKLIETPQGEPALFSKENFSNGCIGTVDITYPSAPLFFCYNTELVKAMMTFIFDYCKSEAWQHPFPAHDVGRYPWANGQIYTRHMPVEESGNMLILAGAISRIEGNVAYASKYWEQLKGWADYLIDHCMATEDELCTDDFAGRMSYNANLSVKGIMGIAAFGDMSRMAGHKEDADHYTSKARELAREWEKAAREEGYYRLTLLQEGTFTTSHGAVFDCKSSWSQKYNMVWDKVLDYDIFDDEIIDTEIAFYLTKQNKYGLPLDSRNSYTKSDWIMWTATMADDDEFELFIKPLHKFMNETEHRIPMTDFYYTDKPQHVQFRCRSVVGGYFMKMLDERLND